MKKFLTTILLTLILVTGCSQVVPDEELGSNIPNSKWVVYNKFTGYQTKSDPTKIDDGANAQGQNTMINNQDRITIRDAGYELFPSGTASTTETGVKTMHNFRKRSGENILMRSYGTFLEWYDEENDTWEYLKTGYTSGKDFGFADYNINTDLTSYVYFGNATEPFSRWRGAHTNLSAAVTSGDVTINVDDTTDGFLVSGTLILCGTEATYAGKTDTSFTGVAGAPDCAIDKGVAHAVEETAGNPRGNIYLVANNRLFISGVASTTQAIFFSKYGDATTFTTQSLVTDTTAEDSGIFNLGEGGGPVTAMKEDEGSIYFFKRSTIRKATLSDSLYTLSNLKPFDGKSQTTGSKNQLSTFAGGNGIFFISPDNQIMNLTRVETIDYPQIIAISDVIKPTIDGAVFDDASGIFWQDKAYIAAKSNSDSTFNDVVFTYDFSNKAWDSPIIGWNVSDWMIYDDGDGERLYFGDVNTANTYKVTTIPLDDIYGVTANWRSKQYGFGIPHHQKEIDSIYIEGYIADNTTLKISLLLDENGFTQAYQTDFVGTETDYLFDSPSYNVFGFSAFGTERFGSNDDFSGKRKFRLYLNKDFRHIPFYNAQIEFASDGENAQWEITRYGFSVRESSQPEDRGIFRAFN